jgi:type III restriction enzyme
LSDEQENLESITSNRSNIDYLIFKQAAATGWDCPRASILVMFREIGNPIFKTQVLGRIRRMPEAKHYNLSILNNGYVFTNYTKNSITQK